MALVLLEIFFFFLEKGKGSKRVCSLLLALILRSGGKVAPKELWYLALKNGLIVLKWENGLLVVCIKRLRSM